VHCPSPGNPCMPFTVLIKLNSHLNLSILLTKMHTSSHQWLFLAHIRQAIINKNAAFASEHVNNNHFTVLCLVLSSLPRWAGTRRNIHPPTRPILIITESGTLHFISSYSIHFFNQSLSSFHNTCPYHHNLFCCSIEILLSVPSFSLNSTWKYRNITHPSDHSDLYLVKCHLIFSLQAKSYFHATYSTHNCWTVSLS